MKAKMAMATRCNATLITEDCRGATYNADFNCSESGQGNCSCRIEFHISTVLPAKFAMRQFTQTDYEREVESALIQASKSAMPKEHGCSSPDKYVAQLVARIIAKYNEDGLFPAEITVSSEE